MQQYLLPTIIQSFVFILQLFFPKNKHVGNKRQIYFTATKIKDSQSEAKWHGCHSNKTGICFYHKIIVHVIKATHELVKHPSSSQWKPELCYKSPYCSSSSLHSYTWWTWHPPRSNGKWLHQVPQIISIVWWVFFFFFIIYFQIIEKF